ncbi:GTP-binding protein (dynamin domain) [Campylobacter blaseri]|uniref:Dynamin N-terminal domain-containing protein n=1 Tax=Campylobacter blaseri TaxID=2042961 RepID=A0A2P8QYH0_9BACT|nr:dynamin family protein [Campylobacter blaseri]PSM51294.1 hypothetical protein CQ405_08665 [Campylobacter blaseri]PSM52438.1 hypothetical protein CRN67_08670 [Campylobacter blaseri]QKF86233.1 GTP-binding protein (dynamin domain) [Campylobacter blaseri]
MLNNFIKDYQDNYILEFEDGFWGDFKKVCKKLLEPKNHPSNELKDKLSLISILEHEPISVAVVGQFSSGKSTFLNTLLGKDILATGITPVTAKTTTIKYSPFDLIKIKHFDGREEILAVNELEAYTDQRGDMKDVKDITIYLSNEALKNFTIIDTPGLNSRSDDDTNETINIFDKIGAVLWVSLIDNAARASEIKDATKLPKYLKNNSLSLLSQKDRISDEECKKVLKYSKEIFKEYFLDVIAISSKLESKGLEDSGFNEVREFLNALEGKKENLVRDKFNIILSDLIKEREFYVKLYIKLEDILREMVTKISLKFEHNLELYANEFQKIYNWINETSSSISKIFETCVEGVDAHYFKEGKKRILSSNLNYIKVDYKSPRFNKDFALSKLLYNDDKLATAFRVFRSKLNDFEKEILDDMQSSYKELEREILLFKGRHESMIKKKDIYSSIENEIASKVASEVYELFLKNYENAFFKTSQEIKLFFEKIDIKISTNYQNSVKLSANLIEDKVLKSIEDYESDPLTFPLFYPKFDDFKNEMLKNLNYYEFEGDFIGDRTFIKKTLNSLNEKILEILESNLNYIDILKTKHQDIKYDLKAINF